MTDADADAIRIYTSKWKMGGLALPCFFVAYAGLDGLMAGGLVRSSLVDGMLLVIGIACGLVLLWMAFETTPVLVIDRRGITCRRPPTGLVPWSAIAGLGLGKVSIIRAVLLIAIDEPAAHGPLADKIKRYKASTIFSPTVARFQGQMNRNTTIQVPISLLAVTGEELQQMLEERVRYAG
jgi:hypothetical protein